MILVDTHVAFWALTDSERLSEAATTALEGADRVVVAGISWYELAWLMEAGRIEVDPDPQTWLRDAASAMGTIGITHDIAHRAAGLSRHAAFPKDPADRLIYSTAVVHQISLVTKDDAMRAFDSRTCIW